VRWEHAELPPQSNGVVNGRMPDICFGFR
jgi:hypothetical protein